MTRIVTVGLAALAALALAGCNFFAGAGTMRYEYRTQTVATAARDAEMVAARPPPYP